MGAWKVMSRRFPDVLPEGVDLTYIGRPGRASPGEGYSGAHALEQERIVLTALTPAPSVADGRALSPFEKPVPGALFVWVKRLSWVELAIFAGLIFFWLLPGFETETMLFGWAHGLGFIALCVVIWIACVRREAPYTLLAATLTPVGPVGSVIGDRADRAQGWGIAPGPRTRACLKARPNALKRSIPLDRAVSRRYS